MSTLADQGAETPLCLLAPDGTLADGHVPALGDQALLSAWRAMLLSRAFDERCFSLQRQGRLGTFSTVNGEEAAVVGSAWALDPGRDWVVPQYRELPAMLRQGYTLTRLLQYFTGDPAGNHMPAGRQRAAVPDLAGGAAPARGRPGVGPAPPGLRRGGMRVLRRRRVLGGRRPRGDEPRGRAPGPRGLPAQEQRLGDLYPGGQADRGVELRRARRRLRISRRARRRQRPVRRARRHHAGRWPARARATDRR